MSWKHHHLHAFTSHDAVYIWSRKISKLKKHKIYSTFFIRVKKITFFSFHLFFSTSDVSHHQQAVSMFYPFRSIYFLWNTYHILKNGYFCFFSFRLLFFRQKWPRLLNWLAQKRNRLCIETKTFLQFFTVPFVVLTMISDGFEWCEVSIVHRY